MGSFELIWKLWNLCFLRIFEGLKRRSCFSMKKKDVSQHLAHDMNVIRTRSMEKQIEASQRFLRGLRSLASFEEVRSRQYRHLRGVIEKAPLVSTACVADLVSSLDASVWEHAQIEELKALLADKLGEVGKERRAMQDYVCLPLYLDQSVWNMLQTTSEQGERFERLCRHAIALGMRCPAE